MGFADELRALVMGEAVEAPKPSVSDVSIRIIPDRQGENHTCGAASLGAVLYLFGVELQEDELAQLLGASKSCGVSPKAIVRVAEAKGVDATIIEGMTVDELREAVWAGRPVIVSIQAWGPKGTDYATSWGHGHYVVVTGFTGSHVLFMDPAMRSMAAYLPVKEFEERWHDEECEGRGSIRYEHLGIVFDGAIVHDAAEVARIP